MATQGYSWKGNSQVAKDLRWEGTVDWSVNKGKEVQRSLMDTWWIFSQVCLINRGG
jgi:hypothetical protein